MTRLGVDSKLRMFIHRLRTKGLYYQKGATMYQLVIPVSVCPALLTVGQDSRVRVTTIV
jgi:hypothetical protein